MKKTGCRFVQGMGSIFLVLAVLKAQALAFPPMNDDFENAINLNGMSGQYAAFNSEATKQTGEPDHFGKTGGVSVWWKWTTEKKSIVRINTLGSDFDTILAVYTGSSVTGLTAVTGNDDGESGQTSEVSFTAQAYTVYFIAVDGYKGDTGHIFLNWDALEIPINDNFADAVLITGESGQISGNNAFASKETGEPNHAGNAGGASVWWIWTAQKNGTVTFETAGSSFHTLLAVYTGYSLTRLTLVAGHSSSSGSTVSFSVQQGGEYRIAVDGYNGNTGQIILKWNGNYAPAPANDNFADAIEIFGEEGQTTGSNINATKEDGEPNIHDGIMEQKKTVWWIWTE